MKKSSTSQKPRLLPKILSFYYGNPAKDMRLIVVASDTSSPLPNLIQDVITASGEKAAVVSGTSLPSLHRALSKVWKAGANYVVISAPLRTLAGLPVHILVTDQVSAPSSIADAPTPSFLVLNRDDLSYPALKDTQTKTAAKSYGHHRDADTRIDSFKPYKTAVEARLTMGNRIIDVAGFLTGDTAPTLLAAAATVADLIGLDKDTIIDGLASYEPTSPEPELKKQK